LTNFYIFKPQFFKIALSNDKIFRILFKIEI
jgi:hypothetical protein